MMLALVVLRGAAAAPANEGTVTVEAGPTSLNGIHRPCNDAVEAFEEQRSFVLRRTGPTSAPLTVPYAVHGSAQPAIHYQPLPGSVTFPMGSASTIVDVVPLASPGGAVVDLTMELLSGAATIRFISPLIPVPVECGYYFTAGSWNRAQTVAVAQPLHQLTLEELWPPIMRPATGRFRLAGGTLPPGVRLNDDGSFAGTPLVPGTFVSRIEACRPAPPGTCIATDLTVTSTGPLAGALSLVDRLLGLIQQLLGRSGLH
jgi:hypothetical protein